MKRLLTAAAIALLSTTAYAGERTQLYTSEYWTAFHHDSNADGRPMCSVVGTWTFPGGVKGFMSLKWTNETELFLHFGKASWNYDEDIDVPLSISFGNKYREASGTTVKSASGTLSMIESNIPTKHVAGFLKDFSETSTMTINFPEGNGNEKPWVAKMAGSGGAVKALEKCISKIKRGEDMKKRTMWVIQIYAAPTDQWIDSGRYEDYGEAHVRMLIAEKTAPNAKWRIVEKEQK